MYAVVAIGLMLVLPIVSVMISVLAHDGASLIFLIGKWFAFWGIGVRLLVAGINQTVRPGFTARGIFKITDPAAETIVTELGYANIAFGFIGILSLPLPGQFLTAAVVAGGLFLGLDGFLHARSSDRNRNETIAMATDFIIPIVGLVYLIGTYA